jgi:hypothetical protein
MGNIQKENLPTLTEEGTFSEYVASAWLWLEANEQQMKHHKRV